MDLTYLLDHLAADPFFKKFRHLNEKLAEVIQDYSLVSFVPLNVQVLHLAIFQRMTLSDTFFGDRKEGHFEKPRYSMCIGQSNRQ